MRTTKKPPHGSGNLSSADTFQMELLTNEASRISKETNSQNLPNVISSPESVDGAAPLNLRGGKKLFQSGREVAHASRLAARVKLTELSTRGIYGQLFN